MSDAVPSPDSNNGCIVIGGIIGLLSLVAYCSDSSDGSPVQQPAYVSTAGVAEEISQQVQPLDLEAVKTGYNHFKKVAATGVQGGSLIYSQNCFAAIEKEFSWPGLDRCGSFDQIAVRIAYQNSGYFNEKELEYFESEATAGRYLASSTKNSTAGDDVDVRFGELQKAAAASKLSLQLLGAAKTSESIADDAVEEDGASAATDGAIVASDDLANSMGELELVDE